MQLADNEKYSISFRYDYGLYGSPDPILSRTDELQITFQANTSNYDTGFLTTFQSGEVFRK